MSEPSYADLRAYLAGRATLSETLIVSAGTFICLTVDERRN